MKLQKIFAAVVAGALASSAMIAMASAADITKNVGSITTGGTAGYVFKSAESSEAIPAYGGVTVENTGDVAPSKNVGDPKSYYTVGEVYFLISDETLATKITPADFEALSDEAKALYRASAATDVKEKYVATDPEVTGTKGTVNVQNASKVTGITGAAVAKSAFEKVTQEMVVQIATADLAKDKAVKDVKFALGGLVYGYVRDNVVSSATQTFDIEAAAGNKPSEIRKLGTAGKATLTITFGGDVKKDSEIEYKLDDKEVKEKLAGSTLVLTVKFNAEDKEFEWTTLRFTKGVKDNEILSAVLSWADTDAPKEPATGGDEGEDINPEDPEDGGNAGGGNETTTNPGTGIVVAIVPTIVAAAAAVVSKKR